MKLERRWSWIRSPRGVFLAVVVCAIVSAIASGCSGRHGTGSLPPTLSELGKNHGHGKRLRTTNSITGTNGSICFQNLIGEWLCYMQQNDSLTIYPVSGQPLPGEPLGTGYTCSAITSYYQQYNDGGWSPVTGLTFPSPSPSPNTSDDCARTDNYTVYANTDSTYVTPNPGCCGSGSETSIEVVGKYTLYFNGTESESGATYETGGVYYYAGIPRN